MMRLLLRSIPATRATQAAMAGIIFTLVCTITYLAATYQSLPDLLPVQFVSNGRPSRWQFTTPIRVLSPVFVQVAMTLTLGSIGALLLSRPAQRGRLPGSLDGPDQRVAVIAAEAVMQITLVWVLFQGYAAWALVGMWTTGQGGLGLPYYALQALGIVATVAIGLRMHRRIGPPDPRPFVAEHWRLGHLYKNSEDPALFVPTRDGRRWTLNFGRPVAAALLGIILLIGVLGPTLILMLMLRGN